MGGRVAAWVLETGGGGGDGRVRRREVGWAARARVASACVSWAGALSWPLQESSSLTSGALAFLPRLQRAGRGPSQSALLGRQGVARQPSHLPRPPLLLLHHYCLQQPTHFTPSLTSQNITTVIHGEKYIHDAIDQWCVVHAWLWMVK